MMPAILYLAARGDPANPEVPQKCCPSFTSLGKVVIRKLAEQIATIPAVRPIDSLTVF